MSWPAITAVPSVGGRKPVSMRMVVVLPAPFGPRKPTTSPLPIENVTASTALTSP